MDITSLAIKVTSDGIADATKALQDLVVAADNAEKKSTILKTATEKGNQTQKDASSAAGAYLTKLQAQADLLGQTAEFSARYTAELKGLSDREIAVAGTIGQSIDLYREKIIQQQRDIEMYREQVKAAQEAAQAQKDLDKAHSQAIIMDRVRDWKLLEQAQSEAIKMNKDYDSSLQSLSKAQSQAIVMDKARDWKLLGQAQAEAIRMNKDYDAQQVKNDAIKKTQIKNEQDYIKSLELRVATIGKSKGIQAEEIAKSREYSAETIAKAKELGAALDQAGKEGEHGMNAFGLGTVGAKREVIVLAHEILSGNFSRIPGSLLVLGERMDLTSKIFSLATLGWVAGAAALGALVVAAYQAHQEMAEFNKQSKLTGDFAGVTKGQFDAMAKSISDSTHVTIGSTKDVLQQMIVTGKFTSSIFKDSAETITAFSHVTGTATDAAIEDFSKMKDGVTQWAAEHNAQYHFMSGAQMQYVDDLEKQGRSTEAMKVVLDALNERIKASTGQLGFWEQKWNDVSNAFSSFWDKLKKASQEDTIEQAINKAQQRMDRLKASIGSRGIGALGIADPTNTANLASMQADVDRLKTQKDLQDFEKRNAALSANITQQAQAAAERDKQLKQELMTRHDIGELKVKQYTQDQAQLTLDGRTHDSAEQQLKVIQQIRDAYKDAVVGEDDRKKRLEDALTLEKTSFDREKTLYDESLSVLDMYHSKMKLSDIAFYDGRAEARQKYVAAEQTSYEKQLKLIQSFHANTNNEKAEQQRKEDALTRQHQQFVDKMGKASLQDDLNQEGALQKLYDDNDKAQTKELENLQKQYDALQHNTHVRNLTKSAIAEEEATLTAVTIARWEEYKATVAQNAETDKQLESVQKNLSMADAQIAFLTQKKDLLTGIAEKEAEAEKNNAADKAAKQYENDWQNANKRIADGLYTALSEGSGNFLKKLTRNLKEWAARLVLNPIIQPVSSFGASLMSPNAASAGGSLNGAGFLGSVIPGLGNFSGGFSTGMSAFGSMDATLGSLEAGKIALSAGNIAGGIGSIAGTVAPYIGAALIAKSLYDSFQGETRSGGGYDVINGKTVLGGGPSGGEIQGPQVRQSIQTAYNTLTNLLSDLSSSSKLTRFTAGLESSQHGKGATFAGGMIDGQLFGSTYETTKYNQNLTPEEAVNQFTQKLNQSVLFALQKAADIPKSIKDQLDAVDIKSLATAEAAALVQSIQTEITAVKSFQKAVESMPFNNLKGLSFDAADGLIKLAGGIGNLSSALNQYYQDFYTEDERMQQTLTNVTKSLKDLGYEGITTKTQFRDLVNSLDVTNDAQAKTYASLLALAPAFAQVADYADKATKAALDKAAADAGANAKAAQAEKDKALADAKTSLNDAYNSESTALKDLISRMQSFSKSLRDFRESLLTGNLSNLSPEGKYLELKKQFEQTSLLAKSGDETAIGNLQNISQQFLEASRGYYASSQGYSDDFDVVRKALEDVADKTDKQASQAQQQLGMLDRAVEGILDVNKSVISVRDAINNYFNAGGTKAGSTAPNAAVDQAVSSVNAYGAQYGGNAYYLIPGINDYSAKLSSATDIAQKTGQSVADVFNAQGHSMQYWQAVQTAYESGQHPTDSSIKDVWLDGSHADGLDRVPFDGYRAELHEGERVQTAAQAKDSDSSAAVLREILLELKVQTLQTGMVSKEACDYQNKVADKLDKVARKLADVTG